MASHSTALATRVRLVLQESVSEQFASLTEDFFLHFELPLKQTSFESVGLLRTPDAEDIILETPQPSINTPSHSSSSKQSPGSSTDLFFDPSDLTEPISVPAQVQIKSLTEEDEKMQEASTSAGPGPGLDRMVDRRKDVVASYMSSSPVCLDKDMTLLDAVKALLRHNISGAPVVEPYADDAFGHGRLVGVISEEDLLWKEVEATDKQGISEQFREPYLWSMMASDNMMMEAVENQALKVLSNTVGLSMSEMSISVSPETPMNEAASIMLDAKIKRLPVVAPREGGKPGMTVVGIITRKDMLRHVLRILEQEDGDRMEAEPQPAGIAESG